MNVIAFKLLNVQYQLAYQTVIGRERIIVNLWHLLQTKTVTCSSFEEFSSIPRNYL